MRTQNTRQQRPRTGVLWIHSAPVALQPHLTWAIARLTLPDGTKPGRALWRARPKSNRLCAEIEWRAQLADAEALVDDLSRWPHITFELAIDAGEYCTGMRYLHTPELGTFAASTDEAGNILLNEGKLRTLMAHSFSSARGHSAVSGETGSGGGRYNADVSASADALLAEALDAALGGPWDRAIEPLRPGTAGFSDDLSFADELTAEDESGSGRTLRDGASPQSAAPVMTTDFMYDNVIPLHPRHAVM